MAKQLNLIGGNQIIPTALHTEMEQSYLEYAMSVIVGRALPDVRDGLKPVHRRILYAMHELGLTPDRPFRKCARVVGDVLGKYHPHGDQAVYDALVRMVQEFSSRYPLLSGHGNFGSLDNDPPAAMRYTETRLAAIAHDSLLSNIGEATVDFVDNFDNSQQEPVVLPAQLPLLLLNGCSGIAVGMATNIPPHNLGEVVDGLIKLIDKPDLPDEKLWELIPGPDFPTGGEIIDGEGIRDAYRTGRGTIRVRGVVNVEHLNLGKRKRDRTALVVTEFPFQVNKAGWIEKVAELVNAGRIEGIADIRDESDRTGVRVVIELKRDASPDHVLGQLYHQTALQSNFGTIMLALVNNKPCQLSLRELLENFLSFREETLTRQYTHQLEVARKRLHIAEGLLAALNHLDAVIDILRNAPDGSTAKAQLQVQLGISEEQGDSILAMPMRRLTGLERQKLEAEVNDLREEITHLDTLLSDRHELLKALKKELRSLKKRYGNERRTRIISPSTTETSPSPSKSKAKGNQGDAAPVAKPPTAPPDSAILEITRQGSVYWTPEATNEKGNKNKDFVVFRSPLHTEQSLITITDAGKAYSLKTESIPPMYQKQNTSLNKVLQGIPAKTEETPLSHLPLPEKDVILLTQQGRIKRLATADIASIGNRGLSLVKLKERDRVVDLCLTTEDQNFLLATSGGRILRFLVNDQQIPQMGRTAQGNLATRLRQQEEAVGCVSLSGEASILLVSQLGYAKRIPVSTIRRGSRNDIGTQCLQFTSISDRVVGMVAAETETKVVKLLSDQGRVFSLTMKDVAIWGKDGVGDRAVNLKAEETITQVIPIVEI
ncbi:DNA topoisomerase IV subunit A [Halothece sp. PCC 7418]|uniref:DNA gyrase/topoisomerase IV subunit A n=1 Tax=Halothece sp. (strain PCC 7418) TaxID=65093 RepID=UPI0002A08AF1|nr:DNA topoisomerase (ATP-hydrolyzing) [Halothece sp. PCC 7418]AFZ42931.1 DNA topoisomerase IV subunit A [Halothece sp. PCC 7418]